MYKISYAAPRGAGTMIRTFATYLLYWNGEVEFRSRGQGNMSMSYNRYQCRLMLELL